jgi:SPP1 family predicted phage head-tail adaptor
MKIGELDRRIIIEVSTPTRDTDGGEIQSWATFSTVWANVDFGTGKEEFEAERLTAIDKTKFTIRYLSGVTKEMRINFDSKYYNIRSVKQGGMRKEFLELLTENRD